jgi:sensor histidine kinase YesM
VTVAEEFGFIERYLGIMRVRFGPRLVVRMAVDPRAAGLRILPFVLQPLVENAVDHGIARRRGPARVSVTADLVTHDGASRLRLRVEDDGPGLGTAVAEGIGIGNTRRRLRERYGAAQELVLAEAPGGGTEVRMTIPVGSS